VLLDVAADGILEIGDRFEDAASDLPAGNDRKEAYDGIEPDAEVGVKWKTHRGDRRATASPWGACGWRSYRDRMDNPAGRTARRRR